MEAVMEDKGLRQRFEMKPSASHFGVGSQEALSRKMELDLITQTKQLMHESRGHADSIEHLCEKIKIPYHTLRKLFRRVEGISLIEYRRRCRLQKAEELLSNPNKYIFEVAYEMGFSSDGNFTNWFKKYKGMTPKAYRQCLCRSQE
jgi:two-component system response regulator YesN